MLKMSISKENTRIQVTLSKEQKEILEKKAKADGRVHQTY